MIISSELTGKTYKTVDECLAAEKLFKEEQERKEQEKRAHEVAVQEAYEKAMKACDEYLELVGIDMESTDRGYKVRIHSNDEADKIFEDIINTWLTKEW